MLEDKNPSISVWAAEWNIISFMTNHRGLTLEPDTGWKNNIFPKRQDVPPLVSTQKTKDWLRWPLTSDTGRDTTSPLAETEKAQVSQTSETRRD